MVPFTDKHAQLGVDLSEVHDEDETRTVLSDEDIDALWEDATTVEQYAEDLDALGALDSAVVDALREAREG